MEQKKYMEKSNNMDAKQMAQLLTQDGFIKWAGKEILEKDDFKEFPEELYGVSKETWYTYEAIRRSGLINMWGAKEYLSLSREEFSAIIEHYSEMNEIWQGEFNKTGMEMQGPKLIRNT